MFAPCYHPIKICCGYWAVRNAYSGVHTAYDIVRQRWMPCRTMSDDIVVRHRTTSYDVVRCCTMSYAVWTPLMNVFVLYLYQLLSTKFGNCLKNLSPYFCHGAFAPSFIPFCGEIKMNIYIIIMVCPYNTLQTILKRTAEFACPAFCRYIIKRFGFCLLVMACILVQWSRTRCVVWHSITWRIRAVSTLTTVYDTQPT